MSRASRCGFGGGARGVLLVMSLGAPAVRAQSTASVLVGRVHGAFRDSTYDALAGEVAQRGASLNDEEVARRWRESIQAVARSEWQTGVLARALLTPAQAEVVFGRSGPLSVRPIIYDEHELERTLRLWQQRVF